MRCLRLKQSAWKTAKEDWRHFLQALSLMRLELGTMGGSWASVGRWSKGRKRWEGTMCAFSMRNLVQRRTLGLAREQWMAWSTNSSLRVVLSKHSQCLRVSLSMGKSLRRRSQQKGWQLRIREQRRRSALMSLVLRAQRMHASRSRFLNFLTRWKRVSGGGPWSLFRGRACGMRLGVAWRRCWRQSGWKMRCRLWPATRAMRLSCRNSSCWRGYLSGKSTSWTCWYWQEQSSRRGPSRQCRYCSEARWIGWGNWTVLTSVSVTSFTHSRKISSTRSWRTVASTSPGCVSSSSSVLPSRLQRQIPSSLFQMTTLYLLRTWKALTSLETRVRCGGMRLDRIPRYRSWPHSRRQCTMNSSGQYRCSTFSRVQAQSNGISKCCSQDSRCRCCLLRKRCHDSHESTYANPPMRCSAILLNRESKNTVFSGEHRISVLPLIQAADELPYATMGCESQFSAISQSWSSEAMVTPNRQTHYLYNLQGMYTQNRYRQLNRDETWNNLSHTGQMALTNEYQRNNTFARPEPIDMNGIQNQLALLKQKMARGPEIKYTNYHEDALDIQTTKLNDQLNSLNQRLQQKQLPSQIPRNRAIPNHQPNPNPTSFQSTNNTNFSTPITSNVQNSLNKLQSYQPVAYKQLTFSQQQALKQQPQMAYQPSMMSQQSQPTPQLKQPQAQPHLNQQHQQPQYQLSQANANVQHQNPLKFTPQKKVNAFEEQPAVATKKPQDKIDDEYNEEQLFECPEGCGRQFNQKALQKHVKVCKQVFQTKREEYDSKQARLVNQEQEKLEKQGKAKERVIKQRKQLSKQKEDDPKWKKQSENFRKMLQATKNGGEAEYEEQQELVECGGCGRKFNEEAARRHISKCMEKQKRMRK